MIKLRTALKILKCQRIVIYEDKTSCIYNDYNDYDTIAKKLGEEYMNRTIEAVSPSGFHTMVILLSQNKG